jgi:hypothetical protein
MSLRQNKSPLKYIRYNFVALLAVACVVVGVRTVVCVAVAYLDIAPLGWLY